MEGRRGDIAAASEGLLGRPESLPGTFAGRGKGQATVGTGAFGRCVQGEPRDFPSGSLSASLQPSSHHSLPDGRHLSAAWRFALEMVLVRPLK